MKKQERTVQKLSRSFHFSICEQDGIISWSISPTECYESFSRHPQSIAIVHIERRSEGNFLRFRKVGLSVDRSEQWTTDGRVEGTNVSKSTGSQDCFQNARNLEASGDYSRVDVWIWKEKRAILRRFVLFEWCRRKLDTCWRASSPYPQSILSPSADHVAGGGWYHLFRRRMVILTTGFLPIWICTPKCTTLLTIAWS